MAEQTTTEIINDAEILLDNLPSPRICYHADGAQVYASWDSETPVIITECTTEFIPGFEPTPQEILDLHCDREIPLSLSDIDEDFIEEMGVRNSEFFAGAPEMIRKLAIRLYALNNEFEELRNAKSN